MLKKALGVVLILALGLMVNLSSLQADERDVEIAVLKT